MNRRQRQREFYFTLDNFTYHGYNGLAASVFLVALRDIRYPTIRARNFAKTLIFSKDLLVVVLIYMKI